MIHYSLQHFGHQHQHLIWLIKHLIRNCSSLDLAYDGNLSDLAQLAQQLPMDGHSHLHLRQSIPVLWGGGSIQMQMRDALHHAMQQPDWTWFINLSGTCVPLIHPEHLADALRNRQKQQGTHSYCFSFSPPPPTVWIDYQRPETHIELLLSGRTPAVIDAGVAAYHTQNPFNPGSAVALRRTVHCSEIALPDRKALMIRGLTGPERADRQREFACMGHHVGRNWVILHRSVVEWLCTSHLATQISNMLEHSCFSDEAFFQTCLHNAPDSIKSKVNLRNNLRGRLGSPGVLTPKELCKNAAAGALFTRKVPKNPAPLWQFLEHQLWQGVSLSG